MKKIGIIGSGFAGLAAAACLAQAGLDVTVFEKNDQLGGRARKFTAEGFTFDMGPSWYWMPEVFEDFYNKFDHTASDFYELLRLNPSYRIVFKDSLLDIPASLDELYALFEEEEPGSSAKLKQFLAEAQYKYEVGMKEFVWKPSLSLSEFVDLRLIKSAFKLQMFSSISTQIRGLFKNPKLRSLLEFPVLFLGAKPQETPALYSLMNYADLSLGTWYPQGGMHGIVQAMVKICEEQGVVFKTGTAVTQIEKLERGLSLKTEQGNFDFDYLVGGADYHHIEQKLLSPELRSYSASYWDKRVMAPSSLLYYIGLSKKLDKLEHHNLFFDADFDAHADEIYNTKTWPSDPLFYVCCPSKTDASVAPRGCENIFLLVPTAANIKEDESEINRIYNDVMDRLADQTGEDIRPYIVYKKRFSTQDFKTEYNSFKGNAYGLANTLRQTALLKPKIRSQKLNRLYYTGQLTSPGPGVPPSIISGQVVANEIIKLLVHG